VFKFLKNGKPVDPSIFDNYLGEKGHLVLIERDSKTFVHAHPKVSKDILGFHATFEKPGFYRLWLQFQNQGELYTSDFMVVVTEGKSSGKEAAHEHHNH
jgi:hypothetical protein